MLIFRASHRVKVKRGNLAPMKNISLETTGARPSPAAAAFAFPAASEDCHSPTEAFTTAVLPGCARRQQFCRFAPVLPVIAILVISVLFWTLVILGPILLCLTASRH